MLDNPWVENVDEFNGFGASFSPSTSVGVWCSWTKLGVSLSRLVIGSSLTLLESSFLLFENAESSFSYNAVSMDTLAPVIVSCKASS